MPTAVGTLALAAAASGALTAPAQGAATSFASDVAVQPLPGLDDGLAATVMAVDAAQPVAVSGSSGSVAAIGRVTSTVGEQSLGEIQVAAAEDATRVNRIVERRKEAADRAARAEARARELARRTVLPTRDFRVTATFGSSGRMWSSFHTGTDFATSSGTPVFAVATGEVVFAGYDGPYGNKIVVRHTDGTETWYCHLSAIYVTGGSVDPGDTIGAVGSTGNTTGPHLHFEVHPGGGAAVNSLTWLREKGVDI